jgi:hypothetical protein
MSDERINPFVRDLRARGISVYACLNLTEYGEAGDRAGAASVSDPSLKPSLVDALTRDKGVEAGAGRGRLWMGYTCRLPSRARAAVWGTMLDPCAHAHIP